MIDAESEPVSGRDLAAAESRVKALVPSLASLHRSSSRAVTLRTRE